MPGSPSSRPERHGTGDLGREPRTVLVLDVDDRGLRLREQPSFRVEVVVHAAVEVQMVLA